MKIRGEITAAYDVYKCLLTFFGPQDSLQPRAGSGVVRIDPLGFLADVVYKATKPGLALSIVS